MTNICRYDKQCTDQIYHNAKYLTVFATLYRTRVANSVQIHKAAVICASLSRLFSSRSVVCRCSIIFCSERKHNFKMSSETLLEAKEAAPSQPKRSRKKVCTDWPEEATVKLISAVESQEALWNPSIKAYRNRSLRDSIWTSIAANNLGGQFAVDEVVAKWSNLRVQFRSCETRLKTTKSGQGANENSVHWKFFKSMLFISGANLEKAAESISNLVSLIKTFKVLKTIEGIDASKPIFEFSIVLLLVNGSLAPIHFHLKVGQRILNKNVNFGPPEHKNVSTIY